MRTGPRAAWAAHISPDITQRAETGECRQLFFFPKKGCKVCFIIKPKEVCSASGHIKLNSAVGSLILPLHAFIHSTNSSVAPIYVTTRHGGRRRTGDRNGTQSLPRGDQGPVGDHHVTRLIPPWKGGCLAGTCRSIAWATPSSSAEGNEVLTCL